MAFLIGKYEEVTELTWYSQTMCLLHKVHRARIWFPISSHYFNCALTSIIIESKCAPLITKNPKRYITFTIWMYLCISLLKPLLCSRPVNFTLHILWQKYYPVNHAHKVETTSGVYKVFMTNKLEIKTRSTAKKKGIGS